MEPTAQPEVGEHADRRPVRLGELVALVAVTVVAILGGYELVERFVLPADLPMSTVHLLHMLRGIGTSVAVAALVAWYLLRRGDTAFEAPRGEDDGSATLVDHQARTRQYALWFVQMRWIAAGMAVILIVVAVSAAGILPHSTLWPLLGWAAVLVVANLFFARWARSGAKPQRQILVQALVDLVILTGLLNASGGIENPLYIAYLFHVIIGSILLPRRQAVWVTAGACLLFTVLAVGEYTGFFPHETNVLFPHGTPHAHGGAVTTGAVPPGGAEHDHGGVAEHDHGEGPDAAAAGAAGEPEHASHDLVFVAGRVLPFLAVLVLTSYLTMLVASRLHQSEEALARTAREALLERRRLESVVHAAGLGIVLYDPALAVRWCNRRARQWLGRPGAGDCPPLDGGEAGATTAPPEGDGASGQEVRRRTLVACLAEGRPAEIERAVARPAGGLRHLRHAFSPVLDQEGRVVQAVELIEDVTARKALEAEALHAGKLSALGQMAAGVAHEIGNPLSSLKTRLRLMERRPDPEFLADSLQVLHGQLDRIGRIVRGVSEFARTRRQEWTEWELEPVVEEALSMVRLDRSAKAVTFEAEFAAPSLRVRGARDQILQVLLNLLLNAVQAMPDGGDVRLEGALRDGTVVLSVSDTGVGMDNEVRRRLFDPFFTTRETGTGLGLAISYSLVHAHGGRIEVDSAPGHGSRFTVVLPQEDTG